ncbi:MAG TPA: tetratricopeptide repeat protein [Myxococcota bacterium]|nr:tetratricopeptide repeat protein [Myxococcota bacterium]
MERITGAHSADVEAYEATLARFRDRMNEFAADARAIVDQMEREEREKITLGYSLAITELSEQENALRDLSMTRFEFFLQKYPDSEYTPHVMFRLAELYFELANEEWSQAVVEYQVLEANTPDDQEWSLPPEPTRDYQKAIWLYEKILADHGDYEYIDGAYYMLGYCFNEPLSQQHFEDPFASDDKAKAYFITLVEDYPESAFAVDGNFILGDAYFADNDIEEAIPHFEAVIASAGRDHNLYDKGLYMLSWTYYKLSEYDRTLALFTDLLDHSEVSFQESGRESALKPEAVKYTAISFSDLADKSMSFDDLDWREYADEDMEAVAELFVELGLGERNASPVQVADAWFESVGGRDYEDEIIKSLADVLVQQARFEDAIATYEYIQTRWPHDPENPDYQMEVARLHLNLPVRDDEGSSQALAVLADRYKEDTPWWEANRNNPDAQNRARRYIEQSLSAVAIETHIRAQNTESAEDYSKAADAYREYLQKFPFADDYFTIEWYLADCLYFAGRYEEAIVEYKQLAKVSGHEWQEPARFQLFRSYNALLEERYGTLDKLPDGAEVERSVETAAGERKVYMLTDDHIELIARADEMKGASFDDEDYQKSLEENRMVMIYIPGQILYHHGDFEAARPRLMELIETYPQTLEAEYAASLILNAYTNDNDLEELVKWTTYFMNHVPKLGPAEDATPDEWDDLRSGAEFKLCGIQKDAGEFAEAAACFETWIRSNPDDANFSFGLYNAANNYEKTGKADKANELFEEYINTFPRDDRSKALYFRIATNYASILELDRAITYYDRLYTYFGPRKLGKDFYVDAPNALYMASFMRTGTGDYTGAAEGFHEHITQFPDDPQREQIAWLEGEQWKQVGEAETLRFYRYYLREFPSNNADHVIDALYWNVKYYERKGDKRNLEKAWEELEDNYARLASSGTVGPLARNRAAEAAFRRLVVQYEDFVDDDYPKKEEDMVPFLLEGKVAEYQSIEANCLAIIETYQDFEYSSAAIYIWGSTYKVYADLLYKAPVPKSLQGNIEAEDIWYTKMAEAAAPIEDKAIARFEANLEKSMNEKRSSVWIDRTIEMLNDINPSAYPLEKAEVRGDNAAAVVPSSGPMSQPELEDSE